MPLRAVCCFSHLTDRDAYSIDPHFCVKKFVDALKGRTIKKWASIPVGKGPKRLLEQANAKDAVDWFGEMAADILRNEAIRGRPVLVPFPSSKCDTTIAESKTKRLANAIAARFQADVADIIRFDAPQPSAHEEGGTRDPEEIYQHLRLQGRILKGRPYILVDDVLTSGGHIRAAAALLAKHGARVVLVIGGVSADREPADVPFDRVERELDDFEPDD